MRWNSQRGHLELFILSQQLDIKDGPDLVLSEMRHWHILPALQM